MPLPNAIFGVLMQPFVNTLLFTAHDHLLVEILHEGNCEAGRSATDGTDNYPFNYRISRHKVK